MNISSRCEYACRAMVELALHIQSRAPMNSATIAERRGIPEKYLVHILLQLKRASLVRSVRGAQGGYLLAKPPEHITLLDIIEAIDGYMLRPLPVSEGATPEWTAVWREVAARMEESLRAFTLRNLVDREPRHDMYYI